MVETFSTHKIMLGQVEPKCVLLLKVSFMMGLNGQRGRQAENEKEERE